MPETHDVLERFARLKRHLAPGLSELDVERLVRGAAERRQRRRVWRPLGVGLGLGAAAATLALSSFLYLSQRPSVSATTSPSQVAPASASAPAAPAGPRAPHSIALADASRAIALEPGTELAVAEDGPARVELRLDRGRARFEVTRRAERSFAVRAGKVTVKVVGTVFDVELIADRVGVSVESGTVDVDWGVGQKRLSAGERGWFPPLVLSDSAEGLAPEASGRAPRGGTSASSARPATTAREAEPNVQELFAQVDAERTRNNPARAADLLRQILRQHPEDPRAALAAFTLGRVLLNDLGRPREAAAAFRQVLEKAPESQFAEDALAREVEAWKRAAELERARALARTYLERYPAGRHAQRVKTLVGLK